MTVPGAAPRPAVWAGWLRAGLDLLFPPRCAGCGAGGADWCSACEAALQPLQGNLCPRCGQPLPGRPGRCPACRVHPLPLIARSFALYDGPLARALVQLKYRPNRRLAGLMGAWLAGLARQAGWAVEVVVPVPLGVKRLRRRGYNQAGLIAAATAAQLSLAVFEHGLQRVRETPSQVGLDPAARARNVEGAFRADAAAVAGRSVLLVDDLLTTGATLAACAGALRQAGARTVYGLTVARAAHVQAPG